MRLHTFRNYGKLVNMPYIRQEYRRLYDADVRSIAQSMNPASDEQIAGHINYVITKLFAELIGEEANYDTINAAIGVLECAKLELYRKVAAPYEDIKEKENGEI